MSVYDFYFLMQDDRKMFLSEFENKVVMVVNTASKCFFSYQYKELEQLYLKYKDHGFEIIAVPSGNFLNQECENNCDIKELYEKKIKLTFYITQRTDINQHPFYLYAKQIFGVLKTPKWNFHKYVIDRKGNLRSYFHFFTSPNGKKINNYIKKLLKE